MLAPGEPHPNGAAAAGMPPQYQSTLPPMPLKTEAAAVQAGGAQAVAMPGVLPEEGTGAAAEGDMPGALRASRFRK